MVSLENELVANVRNMMCGHAAVVKEMTSSVRSMCGHAALGKRNGNKRTEYV